MKSLKTVSRSLSAHAGKYVLLGREWFSFILKLDLRILVWVSSPVLIQNVSPAELSDRGARGPSLRARKPAAPSHPAERERSVFLSLAVLFQLPDKGDG